MIKEAFARALQHLCQPSWDDTYDAVQEALPAASEHHVLDVVECMYRLRGENL